MWNLRTDDTAAAGSPVRVLVPDFFVPGRPVQNAVMRTQQFPCAVLNGQIACAQYTGNAGGNHGHAVVSAVAAEFDAARPTGAFPTAATDPQRRIDVLALPVDGYADTDAIVLIGDQLSTYPAEVVQTSLGFAGGSDVEARVLAALAWRSIVLRRGQTFVHVAAAGNDALKAALPAYRRDARLASAWNLAASGGDVDALLAGAGPVAPDVRARLGAVFAALVGGPVAGVGDALTNTVVVGSVEPDGRRAGFSQTPADVTARGTGLTLACVRPNAAQPCNGVLWSPADGTSFSAPQVAGVAAFLRLQKPALSAAALAALLKSSVSGEERALDAYRAVLLLDAGDVAGPVRRRLADVAGGTEPVGDVQPDGLFDQQDLAEYLTRFAEFVALRETDPAPDRSRWDLNGDGYTGREGGGAFDANADGAIGVAMMSIEGKQEPFVESGLRDLDVLCALAYSPLYEGDPSERQSLLGGKCLSRTLAYTVASTGPSAALVRLLDVRTGGTAVLYQRSDLESGSRAGPPTWSPDGSGVVFDAPNVGTPGLSLFRSRLGGATQQITTSFADLCPAHRTRTNTDGDFLYFFRNELTTGIGIYTLRDTGSSPLPLRLGGIPDVPVCTGFVTEQSVSVGGWWAYTVRGPGVSAQVRIRNLGTVRSITDALPGVGGLGYWSPDGQTVAFIISQTLYVARPFDGVPARVIATDAFPFRVSWSPDGQWIAYQRIWEQGRVEIYVLDLETGQSKQVTNHGAGVPVIGIAWRP